MITNNDLIKLFVRVPSNIQNFNGGKVSGANGETRIFFEESTGKIWAKGIGYGGGSLTTEQVQTIVNNTIGIGQDANEIIDRLNEVLAWFENLPEGDAGALALVSLVGHPSSQGVSATGLYALVEQNTTDISTNASAITAIQTEIGTKAVKYTQTEADTANAQLTGAVSTGSATPADYETKVGTAAEGTTLTADEAKAYNATLTGAISSETVKTSSTGIYKYVDDELANNEEVTATALNSLNTRVTALEGFNPWQDYSVA